MKIKTTRALSYRNEAGELVTIPPDVETDHFDDEKAQELIGRGAAVAVLSDKTPPQADDEDEKPPETSPEGETEGEKEVKTPPPTTKTTKKTKK